MTRPVAKLLALAGVLVLFPCSGAWAAPAVNGVFPLGSEVDANNKIVAGPDGNVWLTVRGGGKDVAEVTPAGQVHEFDIPEIEEPEGIAPGPDGKLWVTNVEKAASFSPADPEGTAHGFTVSGIGAGGQIVAGPDGLMWVASNNSVVHFDLADPTGTVQPVTVEGGLSPKDIDAAGPVIAISDGVGGSRIVTFTTAGVERDYAIGGGSQGVAGGPGGQIAFSAPVASPEQAGLITPPGPAQAFELAGDPFGVAFGGDGAYWIVQFAKGQLARVTTSGKLSFLAGLPVESARQITAGPNGTLWVTLQKNEAKGPPSAAVARVSGLEPPRPPLQPTPPLPPVGPTIGTPRPTPETILGKRPRKLIKTRRQRVKVRFAFSSPVVGSTFECALVRLNRHARVPFRPCASPRVYRLPPGRYRFGVRAVAEGVVDPTSAGTTFRIASLPR